MVRTQVLKLMSTLKLNGMRSAYDEVTSKGTKRQHEPPQIVGDLLQSEIVEKQVRSIRYQLSIAKLRWQKTSTTSTLPTSPSMNPWCGNRQEPSGYRDCPFAHP